MRPRGLECVERALSVTEPHGDLRPGALVSETAGYCARLWQGWGEVSGRAGADTRTTFFNSVSSLEDRCDLELCSSTTRVEHGNRFKVRRARDPYENKRPPLICLILKA